MFGGNMKKLIAAFVVVSLLGFALFARAETVVAPDVMVKTAVQDVLAVLKQGKSDKKQIQDLVDTKVLPMFDFTLMTKRAVGPIWKTATPEQKKVLVDQFRDLLVRVFIGKAFTGVSNVSVKFEPTNFAEGDDQVTVKTLISTPGEAPVAVEYDLKKTSVGWKVVDFSVAGPRLALDIYSNQFRDPLQQTGIDGLIKFLEEKNRAAENALVAGQKAAAK
jgi:phospholipid transport system substrate-binding protein